MPQTAPRTLLAALLLPALLPTLLGGCDAVYDDTKGWATRLQASLLGIDGEAGEPAPEARQPAADAGPREMPAPPAVPVEPVATTPLAAPETPGAAASAPTASAEEPQGVLASASDALLKPAPEAPAPEDPAKVAEPAAAPPVPKAKPAVPAAAAPLAGDAVVAVVLHLSSLRSEEAAKRQWSDLQKSFPEPLGGLQAEFRRTELGDKGTFYRVLAGPLPSRDKGSEVCAAVKAKDAEQYCRILPQKPKA